MGKVEAPAWLFLTRRLALFVAVVLLAWGMMSLLPQSRLNGGLGLTLAVGNLIALVLLVRRGREPGPEQKGWKLLAWSVVAVISANLIQVLTPIALEEPRLLDFAYLGTQVLAGYLQVRAILSWPFGSPAHHYRQHLNLLGSLMIGSSLVILTLSGILYEQPNLDQWPLYVRLLGLTIRAGMVLGTASYLLAEDTRRLLTPLGWLLLGTLTWGLNIMLIQHFLSSTKVTLQLSPLTPIGLAGPLSLIAAALMRTPVEPRLAAQPLSGKTTEWLFYLSFLAVGSLPLLFLISYKPHLLLVFLGFLVVSSISLIRQFYLLREANLSNEELEARVLARTKALEAMQSQMLKIERMNSVAIAGAGLTHDLNNSLQVIASTATTCGLEWDLTGRFDRSRIDTIMAAATRSANLTQRLMTYARQDHTPLEPLGLDTLVANLEPILRGLLPWNITLAIQVAKPPVEVQAVPEQIEQMLVNLVANARDAMPDGGRITVTIEREQEDRDGPILLTVADNGTGMPPELVDRVFEPFFTTKPVGKGTGLGLASVRHFMEAMGGAVTLRTELGVGTAFTLRF